MDAITKGTGMPWGPMQTGQPTAPKQPTYATDPTKFTAFDRTPLVNQMASTISNDANYAQAKAQGRASGMGVGQSAFANRQQNDIANAADNRIANMRQNAAAETFQDQLNQMNQANNMAYQNAMLAQNQYRTDSDNYNNENKNRMGMYETAAKLIPVIAEMF